MNRCGAAWAIGVGALGSLLAGGGGSAAQEGPTWAEAGALFAERCVTCHSGPEAPFGLQLDDYNAALRGSWTGAVLVTGDPDGSELIRRVQGESRPRMPLVGDPLSEAEIALLEAWVLAGLPEGTAVPLEAGPPGPATPSDDLLAEEAGPSTSPPGPSEAVTFAHVEPILLQRCAVCHSDAREGGPAEGLRLDSYDHVLAGGERLVVLPSDVEASELVRRVEGVALPRMPYDGPPWLAEEQIDLIRRWIEAGAPDAEGRKAPMPIGREVRYRGRMTGPSAIDGVAFEVGPDTRIDEWPAQGQEAELRGEVEPSGEIRATRLRER